MEKRIALELRGRNPSQVNEIYASFYWNVLSIHISLINYFLNSLSPIIRCIIYFTFMQSYLIRFSFTSKMWRSCLQRAVLLLCYVLSYPRYNLAENYYNNCMLIPNLTLNFIIYIEIDINMVNHFFCVVSMIYLRLSDKNT